MLALYKGMFHDFTSIYVLGISNFTLYFSNTLLLQASLHLIPQIEIYIYFSISKELSITPVRSLPQAPNKRSKDPLAPMATACPYLPFWRHASFVLPKQQLKDAAINPPLHLPRNPFVYQFTRSQLSDERYSEHHVLSPSRRQRPPLFGCCSLTSTVCKASTIAVKSLLTSPLAVACWRDTW